MMRRLLFVAMMMVAMAMPAQVVDDIYGGDEQVCLTVVTPAKPEKKNKKDKKTLKQRVDSVGHVKAGAALERGYWVILADRIHVGSAGYTVSGVNGNSNFIFRQAQEGMVQFAFNHGKPGLNGMGGMTLEGRVKDVMMSTDKKGNIRYRYSLVGDDINAQVDITVYAGSDYAQAEIQPIISGPRFTISGRLLPYIRPRH